MSCNTVLESCKKLVCCFQCNNRFSWFCISPDSWRSGFFFFLLLVILSHMRWQSIGICCLSFFGLISRYFVCFNLIGSAELALFIGMVRLVSLELGVTSNAKWGLGRLEMLRGEFFQFSQVLQIFSLVLFVLGFSFFLVVTVFDHGIFVYSVNHW